MNSLEEPKFEFVHEQEELEWDGVSFKLKVDGSLDEITSRKGSAADLALDALTRSLSWILAHGKAAGLKTQYRESQCS